MFPDFSDRLKGVLELNDSSNLSSLIYMQGWVDAFSNLTRTYGLGLGFNMMGCPPLNSNWIRDIILNSYGENYFNLTDGSFIFSKIIFSLHKMLFFCRGRFHICPNAKIFEEGGYGIRPYISKHSAIVYQVSILSRIISPELNRIVVSNCLITFNPKTPNEKLASGNVCA